MGLSQTPDSLAEYSSILARRATTVPSGVLRTSTKTVLRTWFVMPLERATRWPHARRYRAIVGTGDFVPAEMVSRLRQRNQSRHHRRHPRLPLPAPSPPRVSRFPKHVTASVTPTLKHSTVWHSTLMLLVGKRSTRRATLRSNWNKRSSKLAALV